MRIGVILYTWWNVWKEHNQRIFQGQEKNELQVALLTKEEIEEYSLVKPSIVQENPI